MHLMLNKNTRYCGSRVAMDLRLEKTRSFGTGAAPVVAVQVDARVTVPVAVAALGSGDCRWTDLVSCSCASLLLHLTNSEVLRRAATPSSATTSLSVSYTHLTLPTMYCV